MTLFVIKITKKEEYDVTEVPNVGVSVVVSIECVEDPSTIYLHMPNRLLPIS